LGGSHWCIDEFIACPPATMSLPSAMMLLVFILCASATALASDQSSGESTLRLISYNVPQPGFPTSRSSAFRPFKGVCVVCEGAILSHSTMKLCGDGLCMQKIAAASISIVPTKDCVRAQPPIGHVRQCAKASSEANAILQRLAAEDLIVKVSSVAVQGANCRPLVSRAAQGREVACKPAWHCLLMFNRN
jgi:hypothetical protein